MSINLRQLKREFEVRKWAKIIERHPYVAVLQLTGGSSWGRSNVKARLMGDEHDPHRPPISVSSHACEPERPRQPAGHPAAAAAADGSASGARADDDDEDAAPSREPVHSVGVDARYAVAQHAREGALRTPFVGLSPLFRAAPAAVVFGTQLDRVAAVVRRSRDVLRDAELVGGRFGDAVVTARVWTDVLESPGEAAEWGRFVAALQSHRPSLVRALDAHGAGLVRALDNASGRRVVRVLDKRAAQLADG